jgi:hypothetical protein
MNPIRINIRVSKLWRFRVWLAFRFLTLATMALPKNAAFSTRNNKHLADPMQDQSYNELRLH